MPGGPSDNSTFEELVDALQSLRVAGINDPNPSYEAPLLRALRVPEDMPPHMVQQRVRRVLTISANQLAAVPAGESSQPRRDRRRMELRNAFLIAAGFTGGALLPGDRIEQTAQELNISRRTAYRRVEEAIELIAHSLLQLPVAPMLEAADYVMSASICRVDLSGEGPVVVLERTLLALTEGIDHLDEQLALPLFTGDHVDFDGLTGCAVENTAQLWPSMWTFRLRLPRALKVGESHRFTVRLRLPNLESMEPFMGFMPRTSSFEASVELTFGDRRARVFRVDEAPPTHSLANVPGTEVPQANPLTINFSRLRAGLSYGVRWDFTGDTQVQ